MTQLGRHEHQSLMRYRAADGFQVNALLVTPGDQTPETVRDTPILLQVHGILGHFLARGTPRQLPHALSERGYSSLSIDTRLARHGQMNGHGMFEQTIGELDASIELLRSEGFRNIFVLGYSLGAAMVIHWASKRPQLPLRGLILEGCHYSFPDAWRDRWAQNNSVPRPEQIQADALRTLGSEPDNPNNDRSFVVARCKGDTQEPINSEIYSYRTYCHMISPTATAAMAYRHIAAIKRPMLFLRGDQDYLVPDGEPQALAEIARNAGNPECRVAHIPHARHDCLENTECALGYVTRFLETWRGPPAS